MKTYVIVDGYSHYMKREWENTEPTVTGRIRIVIVHNYIEEIFTDELAIISYLKEAVLGRDYIIRP